MSGTSGYLHTTSGRLQNNTANEGSGLYAHLRDLQIEAEHTRFDQNSIPKDALTGMFHLELSGSSMLQFTDCSLSQNSLSGLYLTQPPESVSRLSLNLTRTDIDGNSGNGLWINASNIQAVIEGGSISDNGRQGIRRERSQASALEIGSTAVIADNGMGGILFNTSKLTLWGQTKIRDNQNAAISGGGISVINCEVTIQDQAEIMGNSSRYLGGGLSVRNATVSMEGGTIHDNAAQREGGGVSLESGGILRQTGGDIYGNSANRGGGVYVGPEAAYTQTGSGTVGAEGLNTAASASGVCNEGVFELEGSRSLENGLWIDSREAAPRITGPLQPGSVIQLDQSGYLSPGSEGAPIVVAQASETYPALNQTDADAFRKPPQNFEHWAIGLSADGAQIVLAPEEYTIHYENLQGAENPNPKSYTYYTPDITLIDPVLQAGAPRFAGWFDALQGGSQVAVVPQGSLGNRTLYARWVEHTLTYHGNDEAGPRPEHPRPCACAGWAKRNTLEHDPHP